jgi:phospho-N-acetylmuramoyl-pentapeptide-transferase
MLFNLFAVPYSHYLHLANLLHYISFRVIITVLLSIAISIYIGPKVIRWLKVIQKHGQPIRLDGPVTHFSKAGTPTMGGIIILIPTLFTTLLLANLANIYIWVVLFVLVTFGGLGLIDDYTKITQNDHYGISGKLKLIIQFIVSIIACIVVMYSNNIPLTHLSFPFFKNLVLELGYFYIPFAAVVVVGSSNAVNLTDGLDGLAVGAILITTGCFGLLSYLIGHSVYANYLQILYVPCVGELSILCAAIIGSSLGFLWYNAQPAEIFMGDTGSLSIGGVIGIISVIIKQELLLVIIGGVFVIETLSVIIQVYYFKISRGKRVFLMAPIHHHFEKKGWPESKVVIRFWILALIFALIGLSSLKIR